MLWFNHRLFASIGFRFAKRTQQGQLCRSVSRVKGNIPKPNIRFDPSSKSFDIGFGIWPGGRAHHQNQPGFAADKCHGPVRNQPRAVYRGNRFIDSEMMMRWLTNSFACRTYSWPVQSSPTCSSSCRTPWRGDIPINAEPSRLNPTCESSSGQICDFFPIYRTYYYSWNDSTIGMAVNII